MSRVVKPAGKDMAAARGRTVHGNANGAEADRLQGRMMGKDAKPNGFLSRHSRPTSGRQSDGPGRRK
jgi:hypothetical protein